MNIEKDQIGVMQEVEELKGELAVAVAEGAISGNLSLAIELRTKIEGLLAETKKRIGSCYLPEAIRLMEDKVMEIDLARNVGIILAKDERSRYGRVPFSKEELNEAKEKGLYLVALPQVLLGELKLARSYNVMDDTEGQFKSSTQAGYLLIGRVPFSNSLDWDGQVGKLPNGFSVPSGAEAVYWLLAYMDAGGNDFSEQWWRVADRAGMRGMAVSAGETRVWLTSAFLNERYSTLGMLASKFRPLI